MKDAINEIYNGFLLRDVLGYILPGSFVLTCLLHFFSLISGITFWAFIALIPDNVFTSIFAICLSYACGHFLSGLFFHLRIFGRLFRYSPKQILEDYPDMIYSEAWILHRTSYKKIVDSLNDSLKAHIERHAALLHFTGHFSAGLLFVLLYICSLAFYYNSFQFLKFGLPFLIILPGIYNHFRRLSIERYLLERTVITSKKEDRK